MLLFCISFNSSESGKPSLFVCHFFINEAHDQFISSRVSDEMSTQILEEKVWTQQKTSTFLKMPSKHFLSLSCWILDKFLLPSSAEQITITNTKWSNWYFFFKPCVELLRKYFFLFFMLNYFVIFFNKFLLSCLLFISFEICWHFLFYLITWISLNSTDR